MNTLEIIIVAAVAAAGAFVALRLWRIASGRETTCGSCPGSCSAAARMGKPRETRGPKAGDGKAPPSDSEE